jgi:hypothetical protein
MLTYLLAAAGLATVCVLWFLIQRSAGTLGDPPCRRPELDCEGCAHGDDGTTPHSPGCYRRGAATSPSAPLD